MAREQIMKMKLVSAFLLTFLFFIICVRVIFPQQPTAESLRTAAKAHYFNGKGLEQKGKYDEAITELKKALEIEPNFAKGHLMLGVCYFDKNMFQETIKECKKSILLGLDKMNMAIAHHNLGAAYFKIGMVKEAELEFKQALQLNPNFKNPRDALNGMGFHKFLGFLSREHSSALGGFLFFAIVMSAFIIATFWQYRRLIRALKKLSNYLPGSAAKFYPRYTGEYQGIKFSISLTPGGNNSPAHLNILFVKNFMFKLTLYKESAFSKLGEKIGLVHETKINDEMFDNEFVIFSDKSPYVASYLINSNTKNAIRELFGFGYTALIINSKGILIQKPYYKLDIDLQPQNIMGALQRLSVLARG
jgi:Tfp pilus assembly protein PilF